ncbi:MAG: hypothetical protein Q9170_002822 [Blastenia crenularia]
MGDNTHSHNPSAQHHVQENHDPALDTANEHVHGHLHHATHAERDRDKTMFSTGTTYEDSNIPSQDPHDQTIHRRHPADGVTIPPTIDDIEKGDLSGDLSSQEDPRTHTLSNFYLRYRIFFHSFVWLLFTGLWLAITLRLFFLYVPITIITRPMHFVWNHTAVKIVSFIPERMRLPAGAVVVVGVLLIGAFASPESQDNTRDNRAISLFGLAVMYVEIPTY